ncbi:protein-L-isoaspartate(D-aspartate) O-methyltransferase [Lysobacter tyrosinilyticus]
MRSAASIVAKGVTGIGPAVVAFVLLMLPVAAPATDDYMQARQALVAELRAEHDPRLAADALAVLERVPRHAFIPAAQRDAAYENRPLGIGYGQTISQPYIVALMTSLAQPRRGQRILEIGTGSGYQAAVLAESGAQVYTIEIIEPLGRGAAQRLQALGYRNIETRIADGYYGWPERGPFDAIVVTAAASSVPPPLIAQLKPQGRMLIPVGSSFFTQTLMLVEKGGDGRVHTQQILPVRFVPLTRGK